MDDTCTKHLFSRYKKFYIGEAFRSFFFQSFFQDPLPYPYLLYHYEVIFPVLFVSFSNCIKKVKEKATSGGGLRHSP